MGGEERGADSFQQAPSNLPYLRIREQAQRSVTASLCLSPPPCARLYMCPQMTVYVCRCDLEGISVSIRGAVSVSLSVRPGSLPLLTVERDPVEVLSHHLKVKTKGP